MSKRKGLSIDEKRNRMLKYILESKSLWTLAELEKELPKKCGIVSQSVKEVLLSLEADGLVSNDKVGVKQLYWAFPSDTVVKLETKLSRTNGEVAQKRRKIETLETQAKELSEGRGESEERTANLERLRELEEQNKALKKDLEEYALFDPEETKKKETMIVEANDSANRWTDNLFSLRSWCQEKFGLDGDALDKQFNIPQDLDYLDRPSLK